MILNNIRDKSIKKRIERELTNSSKSLISISDKKINSIIVFVDNNQTNIDEVFAKELNLDISKIETVGYIQKPGKEFNSKDFLTDRDFNWLGKIKSENIQSLLDTEFDLLINLSVNNLIIDYLVVFSKAKFKVSFSSSDIRLYDFMIANTNNLRIFSKELKKYLEILNKL